MQNMRLFTHLQISRHIGSSSVCSNSNRESRFMKKIMNGGRKTKKHNWYNNMSTNLRSVTEAKPTNKSPSVYTMRKMVIRDKLFMEHITDQMSMSEIADILTESIEITNVKITADFKYVNVFWIQSNTAHTSVSKEVLQQCAKIIQHRLSELRVIGVVPPIQFVEDKKYLLMREVDKKLVTINENLESWSPYSEQTTDGLNIDTINQTSCNETEQTIHESKTEESYIELPVMRHDVLGLDHHKIMFQITKSLPNKLKETSQKHLSNTKIDTDNSICHRKSEVPNFLTQEEQKKIFTDFLNQRRIEEKRKYRMKRSHRQKLVDRSMENIEIGDQENDDNDEMYENKFDKE